MTEADNEVNTPCIGVCAINEETGLCQGCYRTLEEIKGWWDKSNEEKTVLLKELEVRISQGFD